MNKTMKLLVPVALLIVVLFAAVMLYENNEVTGNQISQNTQSTNTAAGDVSEVSHKAPDFTVTDKDGNKVKLSDFKGKPVVINFWATWCYYCTEEMPDFNTAYKEYPEVQFLMINATDGVRETVKVAKEYVADNNFEFDVFFDTEFDAVDTYGVTGFPMTIFIDKDGNLITYVNGMTNLATLKKGIELITE